MKRNPIEALYLRFQTDQISRKKIHLFEEINTNPANVFSRLFVILVRHRQIEMVSDGNKKIEIKVIQIKILNFEDFSKKTHLKNDTLKECQLQIICIYLIYPRKSKTYSDGIFVNIDNSSQCGTHWVCFLVKDKHSFYFESFVDQPDKFPSDQLPKPILYQSYKIIMFSSNVMFLRE